MKDNTICKLILLYILDKIEIPLELNNLLSICYYDNDWILYHEALEGILQLESVDFVRSEKSNDQTFYRITPQGRQCLASFYTRIDNSLREEILAFAKEHRLDLRKRQEFFCDYFQNKDGTYTVVLKIFDSRKGNALGNTLIDMKLVFDDKEVAKTAYDNWYNKASKIYETVLENLFD